MITPKERARILIIDDDEQIRGLLEELLSVDYECMLAGSAEDALAVLNTQAFDLVMSDINMGGISGLDLVPRVLEQAPETVVMLISGQQAIESAIEALRVGAFDYMTKPLDLRHVEAAVRRALAQHQLLRNKRQYENHLEDLVKERTARIEHLAYYDALTDLPNRTLFADRCAEALSRTQPNESIIAVLRVSIDQFNKITDALGHEAGDVLLSEASSRLQNCVRAGETVSRFDGAEFALLCQVKNVANLADISRLVSSEFRPPFQLGGQKIYLTVSMGVSQFPLDAHDSATILKNSAAALQRAKQQGGNNFQFYTADMNALDLKRLALETDLRRAVENEEFITYYQPIVNLVTAEVVGFEALARWQHPKLGVLPPREFIDLAENTGLILDIGDFVMRAACDQTRKWQEEGFADLRIAVNVSARQFGRKDFLEYVNLVLKETGLDAKHLELELTETSIMENPDSAAKLLAAIRRLGVKIAIDDFGTGYSSLSYLKRLPIDIVKLDRSFVSATTADADDAALVMAIITLAHNLRLRVIAEGVETQEQLSFLRLLRCDEGQGYLFGKPAPAAFAESLLIRKQVSISEAPPVSRKPNGRNPNQTVDAWIPTAAIK